MKKQLFTLSVITSLIVAPVFAAIEATPNSLMIVKAKYGQSNHAKSLSAQEAARIVQNKFGGKILKINNSGSKKNPSYRVKLLKDNGHVISVNVDAYSGRVSGN
ncbi:PepSY domain-containing protein [Colwellia sp. C1TZA3]|uniref:PepSY domain-containing protein n=1 Tax=Colwellia sp. C1TZA3 TaxID=2508879 RepID=UPI0011B9A9D2|nr:PepSY domain-containing protein [Colwellia sp. C1TZA3]TWX73905.1 PepSY domain-containing protein [Colwellia sp. C1TZA3]